MYKKILVAIDGSECSDKAFEAALALAKDLKAQLTALYVIDRPWTFSDMLGYDPSAMGRAFAEEGVLVTTNARTLMHSSAVDGDTRVAEVELLDEDVPSVIVRIAVEVSADLIMLGTHGRRGFRRVVIGSVAEQSVRRSTLPVLLIPVSAMAKNAA